MTLATTVAQQTSAQQAAAQQAAAQQAAGQQTGASSAASVSQTALSSLSSNFQDFLGMLMTQLQNQDPTSPMDTNQFTSELVEFSGVEQQINTNTALTNLINLTQSGQVLQSASIVGHQVQLSSTSLPLQNGGALLQFTAASGQNVNIGIYDANGTEVASQMVNATQGTNSWSWNGMGSNGGTEPDGSYTATVNAVGSGGTTTALPFTVFGTVTGVQTSGTTMELNLGALTVPFSDIQSVVN